MILLLTEGIHGGFLTPLWGSPKVRRLTDWLFSPGRLTRDVWRTEGRTRGELHDFTGHRSALLCACPTFQSELFLRLRDWMGWRGSDWGVQGCIPRFGATVGLMLCKLLCQFGPFSCPILLTAVCKSLFHCLDCCSVCFVDGTAS